MSRFSASCRWAVPAATVGGGKESRCPWDGGGGSESSSLLSSHPRGKYLKERNYFIISGI